MQINVTLAGGLCPEFIGFFEAENPDKILRYVIQSLSGEYGGDIRVEKLQKDIYLPDTKTAAGDIDPLRTEHSVNIAVLQAPADIEEYNEGIKKITEGINKILSNCEKYKPVSSSI